MLDTGTSKNYIKPMKTLKCVRRIINPFFVKSLHGQSKITGKCVVGIFGKNTHFFLLPELKVFDAIIGVDLLNEVNANIDFKENLLKYDGGNEKILYVHCRDVNKISASPEDLPSYQRTLDKLLESHRKVFADPDEALPFNTSIVATIKTTDDQAVYSRPYPYPVALTEFVEKEINELLRNKIIQPSRSPYNNPIWIVDKKGIDENGKAKHRMVVDFRKLNEKTLSERYPIPDISVILANLGKASVFSTLDLKSGFHQIKLREQHQQKAAFSINHGKFEFCRLPFGLKNAPSIFQKAIDDVLREEIGRCCYVYIDDVIIFSSSVEQHIEDINRILGRLYNANMRVSREKSRFLLDEVEYLGFVVSKEGIKTCPDKIKDIMRYETPKTLRGLRSFLGLAGYYRRFVRDYSTIVKPLTKYLRGENGSIGANKSKSIKIELDNEALTAFEQVKKILASEDVLLLQPDYDQPFDLTTDASSNAIGAVLSQKGKPITMISRTLTKTEQNYATNERELLAIVWALQKLRNYLYGVKELKIFTDHQPLTFTISEKKPKF